MAVKYEAVPTGDNDRSSSSFSDESRRGSASSSRSNSTSSSSSSQASLDLARSKLQEDTTRAQWRFGVTGLVSLYLLLNLGLTFYNKTLMGNFPYPYLVTALHAGSGVVGCFVLRLCGVYGDKPRDAQRRLDEKTADVESGLSEDGSTSSSYARLVIVLLYSTLYAANIAISNASLRLVTVPFHQIIRSTCPLFTLALGMYVFGKRPQLTSIAALIPVVVGAILSCFGEVDYTTMGLVLTVLGTLLAALKTVTTNVLQGGAAKRDTEHAVVNSEEVSGSFWSQVSATVRKGAFHYTPLQLLEVMSPLACIQCLMFAVWNGEFAQAVMSFMPECDATAMKCQRLDMSTLLLLAGNGFTAFLLNYVSFSTNRAAGPLTMTVIANLKQVMTVVIAFQLYSIPLALTNGLGIAMALIGTTWYGFVELKNKQKAR